MLNEWNREKLSVERPSLRILAAEDNEINQAVLKAILQPLGLEPLIVENGAEAVEAWQTQRFDIVLMDVQMPVLDGLDATREIRRREVELGLAATPIIALTSNVLQHQVAECLDAGMDGHLAKPIQIDKLFATLLAAYKLCADGDQTPATFWRIQGRTDL
ncbi:MAG TPA: response regulator [Caulobacteraceae bacterium]|jgi:CheY-like chemotaxis protein